MKTILFVRHADIDIPTGPVTDDVLSLNGDGRARAEALARVAGAAGVSAVFASAALCTKQTAAPLAAALGLTPKMTSTTPALFAAEVSAAATGPVALVVGHSTTVPALIAALSVPTPVSAPIGFDDLFVVTLAGPGAATVVRLKYGAVAAPSGPRFVDHGGVASAGAAVEFAGSLFAGREKPRSAVSGGDAVGEYLVLVSDEMKDPTAVQLLKREGAGYGVDRAVELTTAGNDEVDLEGVAADRATGFVYVTGSHTRARKIEDGVVGEVKRKKPREQFFRFRIGPDGGVGPVEGPKSILPAVERHPVLGAFAGVAGKENGIDVEGLAVKNGRLYFGFRGPVLRDGWVPVLSRIWDGPDDTAQVVYLRLDGRGIRDLSAVADGFLVLAGPVGDGDGSYRVYFWDGADQLAGGGTAPRPLGEFVDLGKGKPEGLIVLGEAGRSCDVLLLCDGLPNGGPTRWTLTRP